MSVRKLKIWNGNAQTMIPWDLAKARLVRHNSYVHAYACAHSRADLCRMLAEWSNSAIVSDSYIRDYWSEGAWGNAMTGITPERGLWLAFDHMSKPERVWPPDYEGAQK